MFRRMILKSNLRPIHHDTENPWSSTLTPAATPDPLHALHHYTRLRARRFWSTPQFWTNSMLSRARRPSKRANLAEPRAGGVSGARVNPDLTERSLPSPEDREAI